MKLLFKLVTVMGMTALPIAKSAPPQESQQLPAGPLLQPVPDFSRWTIVSRESSSGQMGQEQEQNAEAKAGDGNDSKNSAVKSIVGQRTRDIRHIVITYGNGNKMEFWKKGGVQSVKATGWNKAVVTTASEDDLYGNLGWISADNFQGIQKVGGKDCMVFRDNIPPPGTRKAVKSAPLINLPEGFKVPVEEPVDPESLKIKAVACVEVERRVPVVLQLGNEVTTYKFEPIDPPVPLNLPVDVQAEMAARNQQARAAVRKPPQP
jgi:hypothetical protein